MPGLFIHFAFIEELYRMAPSIITLDKIRFMSGSLIPDLAKNKNLSHYRREASSEGFFVPKMETVREDLFVPNDPIKFGMFCHLYLDYHFIEDFLIPEFIWDTTLRTVTNPRNGNVWSQREFFSQQEQNSMYSAYKEINSLILRDKLISVSTIRKIPDCLPPTGLPVFDSRCHKTWKEQFEKHLQENVPYTGNIFDYNRLWNAIQSIAETFLKEYIE